MKNDLNKLNRLGTAEEKSNAAENKADKKRPN